MTLAGYLKTLKTQTITGYFDINSNGDLLIISNGAQILLHNKGDEFYPISSLHECVAQLADDEVTVNFTILD